MNWWRKLTGKPSNGTVFPNTYAVLVSLRHPRVKGNIVQAVVTIDAHNRRHAARQLKKELTITIEKTERA